MCLPAPKLNTPAPIVNPPAPPPPPEAQETAQSVQPAAASATKAPRRKNSFRTDSGAVDSVATGLNIPS